ncbi:hypothetical protein GOODEAATRI_007465 [Goodea atripinnis]|uniref:PHD-type domain-containing protein n=1 Tax=Goodea atripinnis TaxID=208336 RepID=A0ABV0PM56_9TELE
MAVPKQGKGKKDKKKKFSEKKEALNPVKAPSSESGSKPPPAPLKEDPAQKNSETPPLKLMEEKSKQQPQSKQSSPAIALSPAPAEQAQTPSTVTSQPQSPPLTPDTKQLPVTSGTSSKKGHKPHHPELPLTVHTVSATATTMATCESGAFKERCFTQDCFKRIQEKIPTAPNTTAELSYNSTPSTRDQVKSRAPCDGVHRIRVDFKRDHDVEKVWEAGGLSLLTSVPITPRVLCFLCASSGNVEFVFCQVCCEPFHLFCLGESERPLQEQFENWCCRRCRFCQACGRQHQKAKVSLLVQSKAGDKSSSVQRQSGESPERKDVRLSCQHTSFNQLPGFLPCFYY